MKALLLIALLSGCATVYSPIAEKAAADSADNLLAKGIYAACVAPTVGSLQRRFPNPDDLSRYIENCVWMRQ